MLDEAARLPRIPLVVEQGSYSPGNDPTSAGTHDSGGAVDLDAEALTRVQRTAVVTALRRVGFAAWLRGPKPCRIGRYTLYSHARGAAPGTLEGTGHDGAAGARTRGGVGTVMRE